MWGFINFCLWVCFWTCVYKYWRDKCFHFSTFVGSTSSYQPTYLFYTICVRYLIIIGTFTYGYVRKYELCHTVIGMLYLFRVSIRFTFLGHSFPVYNTLRQIYFTGVDRLGDSVSRLIVTGPRPSSPLTPHSLTGTHTPKENPIIFEKENPTTFENFNSSPLMCWNTYMILVS